VIEFEGDDDPEELAEFEGDDDPDELIDLDGDFDSEELTEFEGDDVLEPLIETEPDALTDTDATDEGVADGVESACWATDTLSTTLVNEDIEPAA